MAEVGQGGALSRAIAPDARILAINVARIGDTLLAAAALAALKQAAPRGRLTCMAHPKRLEILQGLPCLDELLPITKQRAFWRGRWAGLGGAKPGGAKPYDLALIWGRDVALVRYALRVAKRVVAFRQGDAEVDAKLVPCVEWPTQPEHAVDHRFALLTPLGIAPLIRRLDYRVTPAETDWAGRWLAQRFPAVAEPLPVCLQTASFPTKPYRDWPAQNFRELAQRLLARNPQQVVILLGGPEDRQRAAAIAAELGPRVTVSAGELSLRQSAALIARSQLYLGVDTGMTHVAGAIGVPMVGLYHCLHPGRYLAPLDHPAPLRVLEHPLGDGPCDESRSMAEISVESVWQAATEVLAASSE